MCMLYLLVSDECTHEGKQQSGLVEGKSRGALGWQGIDEVNDFK